MPPPPPPWPRFRQSHLLLSLCHNCHWHVSHGHVDCDRRRQPMGRVAQADSDDTVTVTGCCHRTHEETAPPQVAVPPCAVPSQGAVLQPRSRATRPCGRRPLLGPGPGGRGGEYESRSRRAASAAAESPAWRRADAPLPRQVRGQAP